MIFDYIYYIIKLNINLNFQLKKIKNSIIDNDRRWKKGEINKCGGMEWTWIRGIIQFWEKVKTEQKEEKKTAQTIKWLKWFFWRGRNWTAEISIHNLKKPEYSWII